MTIAALYIFENSLPHIFGENHKGKTINLGGRYLYKLEYIRNNLQVIEKSINNQFIENFWTNKVNLVSAIVGSNGTGKSTILNLLKLGCEVVLEDENYEPHIMWTSDSGLFFYYTPYLSENNAQEDMSNVHNLSKLSQIRNDTKAEAVDFNTHWEYHNSERLKRVISFLNQEKYSEILTKLKITKFNKIEIHFLKIPRKDWNTSRNFIGFFDAFQEIIKRERETEEDLFMRELKIDTVEQINESEEYNKFSRKLRLKLSILEGIIKKLHNILERTGNKFLEEGFLENDITPDDNKFRNLTSTKEAFYWFLDNAYFELRKQKFYLPKDEIKEFTDLLLSLVEEDNNIENWTILTVDFENCNKVIAAYQKFLLSFKKVFIYDETIFISFEPDIQLSTGEMAIYELFSSIDHINYRIKNRLDVSRHQEETFIEYNNYILLLDEADLGFHPIWKRSYINSLIKVIPEIFQGKSIQIILTTHSPISLSDIPSNNIVFLDKELDSGNTIIIDKSIIEMNSFGANVTDLLSNSFFLKDYLIGDFVREKINMVIDWININKEKNGDYNIEEFEKVKKTISLIEEPVLRSKLIEMLSEIKIDSLFIEEMIKKETEYLRKLLNNNK